MRPWEAFLWSWFLLPLLELRFWDIIKLGGIVAVGFSLFLVCRGSFMLPLVLATQGADCLLT
eukprot:4112221-Amphidinium_carterae.1